MKWGSGSAVVLGAHERVPVIDDREPTRQTGFDRLRMDAQRNDVVSTTGYGRWRQCCSLVRTAFVRGEQFDYLSALHLALLAAFQVFHRHDS